jgi:hypothetical protein
MTASLTGACSRRRRTCRPALEALEDRLLLSGGTSLEFDVPTFDFDETALAEPVTLPSEPGASQEVDEPRTSPRPQLGDVTVGTLPVDPQLERRVDDFFTGLQHLDDARSDALLPLGLATALAALALAAAGWGVTRLRWQRQRAGDVAAFDAGESVAWNRPTGRTSDFTEELT